MFARELKEKHLREDLDSCPASVLLRLSRVWSCLHGVHIDNNPLGLQLHPLPQPVLVWMCIG